MSDDPKSFFLSPAIHRYLVEHGNPPDSVQRALIDETAALGGISGMQIAPEQGAFMTLLTKLVGARHAIEVGTFTGYSALCIARGPAGGRDAALLRRERGVDLGRAQVLGAGRRRRPHRSADRARGRDAARAADGASPIDLAFVDADKPNYAAYYEELLPRLRAERRDAHRQRALGRQRHRRRTRTTRTGSRSGRSTTWWRPTTGSRR